MTQKSMLRFSCVVLSLFQILQALAQFEPKDPNKLQKLDPESAKQYQKEILNKYQKQLNQLSKQTSIALQDYIESDEEISLPQKNLQKLSSIPSKLFTKKDLVEYAALLEKKLLAKADSNDKLWLDTIQKNKSAFQQHNAATGQWYKNEHLKSLLLQLKIAAQYNNDILAWNNLGAMLNMAGLPHKAIPVLKYCNNKLPQHNIILNNLGQSYIKLGDVTTGKQYLHQSLAAAPFNPDANHTMGIISLYQKDLTAARNYFERALQTSQRASTIAHYIRAGGKINLSELRKMKNRWTGKQTKNYFDDLSLEQFDIDFFPKSLAEVYAFKKKMVTYNPSVDEEIQYWFAKSTAELSSKEKNYLRHDNGSVYSEIVDALLEELHKEFHPNFLALPFEASDLHMIQQTASDIEKAIRHIDQTIIAPAGSNWDEEEAYRRLRCEKKKGVYDQYIPKYNAIIEKRYKLLKGRWKAYINQLIPILALDPTPGNRRMAYGTMMGYFSMLKGITGSTLLPDYPLDCTTEMKLEQAEALLQSKRKLDFECPEIFELEGELFGVNISVNCDGLKIDAGMETEPLGVGYEKNFKTGMSTLWLGIGMEGALEFDETKLGEGKLANQLFISFDKLNRFADAGYRGQATFEGKGDNSIDFNYSFAMNAGFGGSMQTSGVFQGIDSWLE